MIKKISWWDKILVNYVGIIPNKPEVREYLNQCYKRLEMRKIFNNKIQRVK